MELSYRNNPKSLFRKYAKLVTWFAQLQNKNIVLYLPNGHIEESYGTYRMSVYSRAINAPALLLALIAIDALQYHLSSFKDAMDILYWYVQGGKMPALLKRIHFTTLTFNPNANPETTSVDGYVGRAGVSEDFATIRSSVGNQANDTSVGSEGINVRMFASGTEGAAGKLQENDRSVLLFDTSSLTIAASISDATLSTYILGRNVDVDFFTSIVLSNPVSNTALTGTDYNIANWTMTNQSDVNTAALSLNLNAYNDYLLNTTGLGNISKNGITKLGMVSQNDRANSAPGFTTNGQDSRFNFEYAENSGGHPPKLTIDFTGTSNFKKVNGVIFTNIKKISGLAIASVKKVAGV